MKAKEKLPKYFPDNQNSSKKDPKSALEELNEANKILTKIIKSYYTTEQQLKEDLYLGNLNR